MSNKKQLLFITSRFPYPLVGGDRIRSYNLLKILAKKFDVHLISLVENEVKQSDIMHIKGYVTTLKTFRKNKFECCINLIKSFFSSVPMQVSYYYFKDVKKEVDFRKKKSDICVASLVRTSKYLMDIEGVKILDMCDSIALNYQKSLKTVSSNFWKLIYKIEAKRLKKFELKCYRAFDNTSLTNKQEFLEWSKISHLANRLKWLPNGVRNELFTYAEKDLKYSKSVVFFGKMDYQPNVDAVVWFSENVLPFVNSEIEFLIVGAHPSKNILKIAQKNPRIKVTGYIEDPYIILNSCLCSVAPMQTGGGIQNKVLESMALGVLTITTYLAGKPIVEDENNKYLIMEDEPVQMAGIINKVHENTDSFLDIKNKAKEFIKSNFTWDIYEEKVLKMINEIERSQYIFLT